MTCLSLRKRVPGLTRRAIDSWCLGLQCPKSTCTRKRWHTSQRRFSRVHAARLALCLCIASGAACVDDESIGRSPDQASSGPIGCETRAPSIGGGSRRRWVVSHGRSIMTEPSPGAVPLFDPVAWRLCFRFVDGDAYDAEIVDYH